MSNSSDDLICVAAIAGAFGVKGEVRLKSFTQDPLACVGYGPLLDADGNRVLTPKTSRAVKGFIAVTAPEVSTREQAEGLKSTKLYVPRHVFPDPDADDFYYSDLIGLSVKSTDGKRIGTIVAVHEFGAGDMLEIKPKDGASFFPPFTKAAVPRVNIKAGRVIVVL